MTPTVTAKTTTKSVTPDKNLRRVLEEAIERGWELHKKNGHPWIQNNGHVVRFSATPSDGTAYRAVKRDINKCETGRCKCKGGKPIVLRTKPEAAPHRGSSTMTTHEATEYLHVSASRIMQLIKDGRLEALEPPARGRITRITLSSIEAFEQARKDASPRERVEPNAPTVRALPPSDATPPTPITNAPSFAKAEQNTQLDLQLAVMDGFAMGRNDDDLMGLLGRLREILGRELP